MHVSHQFVLAVHRTSVSLQSAAPMCGTPVLQLSVSAQFCRHVQTPGHSLDALEGGGAGTLSSLPMLPTRKDVQNSGAAMFLLFVRLHVVKGCVTQTANLHHASVHTALRVLIQKPN